MGRFLAIILAGALAALGQQSPFLPISGPDAPRSASFLFHDKLRGGLWLGGVVAEAEGLTYFDGSRFIWPLREPFPKVTVIDMAEDSDGGIWLATSGGLYRMSGGHLEREAVGRVESVVQISPQVFVATATTIEPARTQVLRIHRRDGRWIADSVFASTTRSVLRADGKGNILFGCAGGYCEISRSDVVQWHPGATLPVRNHPVTGLAKLGPFYLVSRDRSGCVWMSQAAQTFYQCPGDASALPLKEEVAGTGAYVNLELKDGSMAIPSFSRLAIGRPGNFKVLTAANGYPGAINVIETGDDSLWMSNANGLFVLPRHLRMEFWTERDGLAGNSFGIFHTASIAGKTFAITDRTLRTLGSDRSRWIPFPIGRPVDRLFAASGNGVLAGNAKDGMLRLDVQGRITGRARLSEEAMGNGVVYDTRLGAWTCSPRGLLLRSNVWRPFLIDTDPVAQGCRDLALDRQGNLWYGIAPPGQGFGLVVGPGPDYSRVMKFSSVSEVGSPLVRFLGVDRRGWIWRGSPKGVYVAYAEQARRGEWLYLTRADGIAGTDANRHSFFSDADGSVWFGLDFSIDHLFPPEDLVHPGYSPSVFISGFSLNSGAVQMAETVDTIENRVPVTAHIGTLQYDRRSAVILHYRLLPEQTAWKETKSLDLMLGSLPPGAHRLEVQGRIFTGPWSATANRSFHVLRPTWSGSTFLLLYSVVAMGLAGSFLWYWHKRRLDERALLPDLRPWRQSAFAPEMSSAGAYTIDERFEVGEVLATGAFASVVAAYDVIEERACALKIFRIELEAMASFTLGFSREVQALRQIGHPNVVSIYADGRTAAGAPYFAMEYIQGETLRDALKHGPLAHARAGRLLEQMAGALDAIHEHRIFHRDIKPENIMLRNDGADGELAILIDFSIAIIKRPDETLHGLSLAAGTFNYMAPEQALGHAQPASDIFSLAKVAIEMLTGKSVAALLPDAGLGLAARIPDLLRDLNLHLTEESLTVLATALEFDPAKRPGVASLFARPIARDLMDHSITVSSSPLP